MKIASLLFENLIQDGLYGDHAMPFLWQVIYHEAMRGNHMLFESKDLETFESDHSRSPVTSTDTDTETMSNLVFGLFSCNDLATIQSRIKNLPFRQKKQVHKVYLRFLERWRFQIKQSLN